MTAGCGWGRPADPYRHGIGFHEKGSAGHFGDGMMTIAEREDRVGRRETDCPDAPARRGISPRSGTAHAPADAA